MKILLGLAGLAVGFICWMLTIILFKGAGPFGSAGGLEVLMFLGPFAILVPWFVGLAARQAAVAMLWLAALSPAISVLLNLMVFAIAVSVATPGAGKNKDAP